MYQNQAEQSLIHIGSRFARSLAPRRRPVGGRHSRADNLAQGLDRWAGIRLEEPLLDLAQDVADGLCLVSEFDGEGVLELDVEIWNFLGPEGL